MSNATHRTPDLDGPVLNPEPIRRTEGADRLGVELVQAALALPAEDARARLAKLAGGLHTLDPIALAGDDTRLALWLNVYNSLVRQAFDTWKIRGSVARNLGVFRRAAWAVGGRRYSANLIEHGLLRDNARVPPLRIFRTASRGDPRLGAAPSRVDPRIHFALNCGARSCPPVRAWFSGTIERDLEAATRAYVVRETSLDRAAGTIALPRLMKYYAGDFGTRLDAVRFAARCLPDEERAWVAANESTLGVKFSPYDWTVAVADVP